ncbi:family 43 glycosylhydrolase [Pelagicoccus sp. SDUM812003]|uniref:family 43 glycosylhydrolase n=1 Tax=Pelagicoccus sp. SDUM812003 TaxID=3041267 RepID=UPI00280D4F16|nr:family 43 glycosylhydrolase [Pelagicoccus sp. SDUM812003]MDQ8203212.1 family 43 glycosylhydrolase [Pelagicoccus sp. SDUM812003]
MKSRFRTATYLLTIIVSLCSLVRADTDLSWTNPLIAQRADPHVALRSDGYYYLLATAPEYDRIEIRRSKSIAGLATAEAKTVWRKNESGPLSGPIWAPELHYLDGSWYIYVTSGIEGEDWRSFRVYALENDSPDPMRGEWIERGPIVTNWESFSLDATVFEHQGERYYLWTQAVPGVEGTSVLISKMDTPLSLTGEQTILTRPEYDWEKQVYAVNEAPAVLVRNGKVFVTYSASATDHNYCLGLLTADADADLLDPDSWSKAAEPVFKSDETTSQYGPGHNSFTTSKDGSVDIIVYHSRDYKRIEGEALANPDRATRAQALEWDAQGNPIFASPVADGPYRYEVEPLKASLEVDLEAPGKAISRDLVGIFYEDLNYAADGGLYAELIQNRSFEYSATEQASWGPLSFWDLVTEGEGTGYLGLGNARPVHVKNPHYLLLNVENAGDGVGVSNGGFDEIPLVAGESYQASFWAYQTYMGRKWGGDREEENQPMPVELKLVDELGQVLARADFTVKGREWTQHQAELVPSRSVDKSRLVLLAKKAGGLAVDMVSLFPNDTFMGRENGLRRDLAQAIADINPKFMRFPGGCLVHGQGVRHYYDWKDSVGPVETREGQRNSWGYHQTLGLGYHEYFQFCEDIDAIPIPVVSAGVCCQHAGDSPHLGQEGLPMEEMPGYIQDVLDLIEWANGPADSQWGAVRAAAGHPEPFGLKYIGVGNEDAITSIFKVRFQMIRDAIAEAYPEIVVIGTVGPFASGEDYDRGWEFARELDLEMVDEHYYVSPQWFWDNLDRYDSYDRDEAAVYLGEYAAHEPDRRNTLRSALAEAAGLTSYERNGDIVRFVSYAPLLARRGHTQWTPDMIYFDADSVYLTPNYYVQKLFGRNAGNVYIPSTLQGVEDRKIAVSATEDTDSGDLLLKIVNGENAGLQLALSFVGWEADAHLEVTETVLTGPGADAVNVDGAPPAVAPVTKELTLDLGKDYFAPANSLTVLRMRK